MNSTNPLKLAIVDDFEIVRYSLRLYLSKIDEFEVSLEASNGLELIEKLQSVLYPPDIIILDIGMPVMNGYETVDIIKVKWPAIKIIILSQYCHEFSIGHMISKGINAYIKKKGSYDEIKHAISTLKNDEYYYSEVATEKLYKSIRRKNLRLPNISNQQKHILKYFVDGKNNKEIASAMNLSPETVESYRKEICRKFNLKHRMDIVKFALLNELVFF